MTLENCRSTTGRVCPEQVKGMARGVEAMAIVRWREGWWMKERERGRDGEKRGKGMERRRCKGEDERTPPTGACFQRARGKPARKEDKCCSTCDAVNTATVLPPQMGFFQLFASLWPRSLPRPPLDSYTSPSPPTSSSSPHDYRCQVRN